MYICDPFACLDFTAGGGGQCGQNSPLSLIQWVSDPHLGQQKSSTHSERSPGRLHVREHSVKLVIIKNLNIFRNFDPENTGKISEELFKQILKTKDVPERDINEMIAGWLDLIVWF